jgi:MFS family permease
VTVAVFLVSAALLAHEVCLLRLLSIAQWHHSAGLVVSVALLAFGVSGTLLARFPRLCTRAAVHPAALLYGLLLVASVRAAADVDFNVLEVGWRPSQWLRLGALQLIFFAPFLAAATAVAAALASGPPARLYGANLLGSGTGALLAPLLLDGRGPEEALRWIAAAVALAAASAPLRWLRWAAFPTAAGLAIVGVGTLPMSPFKDLPALPEKEVLETRHTALGRLDRVRSASLHVAPGLSLLSEALPGPQEGLFFDGSLAGVVDLEQTKYFRHTLFELPYRVTGRAGPDVQLGAGPEMGRAALVVEPLLGGPQPRLFLESLQQRVGFLVHHLDEAHAAAETPLLTVEALRLMLSRTEAGVVLGAPLSTPPRAELRLLLTAERAAPHVVAAQSHDRLLVWLRHAPLSTEETARMQAFCDAEGFDPVRPRSLARGVPRHERAVPLEPPGEDYPYDVEPVTDARPYFHKFFRWSRLDALFDHEQTSFVQWTFVAMIVAFGQVVALALLLMAGPLVRSGAARAPAALFLGLGAAYMLLEMAFLQRAIVRVGGPVDAAAAVVGGFLLGSGAGSLVSSRLHRPFRAACAVTTVLAPVAFVFVLPRTPVALAAVCAAVAFPMGMPFPSALARIAPASLPWAIAWNGFASVAAAAGAPLLACTFGIPAVAMAGVGVYALLAALTAQPGR